MAAGHPRPDVRRPQLRRAGEPLPGGRLDLPVVEAAVEQDARLVHRLDLLLGRRRSPSPRSRSTVPLVLSTIYPDQIKLADPSPIPGSTCSRSSGWPRSSRRRSSTPSACGSWLIDQQHRRRRRDRRDARLRADPAVLREPPVAVDPGRYLVHGRPGRTATTRPSSLSACSWPCSSSTASTRPGPSARRPSTRAARRRAASCPRSGCPASSAAIFLLAVILSFKDVNAARSRRARHSASRSRPRSRTT